MQLISRFWHLNYNTENSAIGFQGETDNICIPPYESVTQGKMFFFFSRGALGYLLMAGVGVKFPFPARLLRGTRFLVLTLPKHGSSCPVSSSLFLTNAGSFLTAQSSPLCWPQSSSSSRFVGPCVPPSRHGPSQAHPVSHLIAPRHLFNQSLWFLCLPVASGCVLHAYLPWLLSLFSETFSAHTVPTLLVHRSTFSRAF